MMRVIPLGFEPKTHSLEGCCSNPTELRNHTLFLNADAKLLLFLQSTKYFRDYLLLLLSAKCLSLNFISLTGAWKPIKLLLEIFFGTGVAQLLCLLEVLDAFLFLSLLALQQTQ